MPTCASCAHENRDGAKFCEACATPLVAPARAIADERKVITALFCDLVGFTATSEAADPEDVDAMLAVYFAMARAEIESFGGIVEKFIGDAVVGVFGVPAAHEDDPERAVRAGLQIAEEAEQLEALGGAPLKLRVGINTGEALVRLGIAPTSGRGFLSGDSINTASRIQSVAPEMGVAVGLGTYEATAAAFDYVELEPAVLKGKSEPVRVFQAKAPRARLGTDLTRTHDTPFIGREIDLAIIKRVFEKTVAAGSPQLITVVGEPGLGKSRIVAELGRYVDDLPARITWRQGRCLPYGEGITFWALGEILRGHAGILESDPPEAATAKLDEVLPEGPERAWFRQRLLPLLGIEATSTADREELFTAWRRFLEHIAEQGPTVIVFEDLHWADEAMLAFLEHLAGRAEAVPLLVIGTARPELFERRAGYAAGLRNITNINLSPLSEEETARLVSALLETTVVAAELQRPIVDRAGGNPLYAEEFVRLLKDKDLLVNKGQRWQLREGAEVPFPDSVQALIAARLDTLSWDAKSVLADAAVIGKVFWAGAIAQMGDLDVSDVSESLRDLSLRQLVRPARRSSIEGETEYAFWHVLTRDVVYGQLPRASRASRHAAAARWLESKAHERVEDLANVLAYHYTTALELARAAGDTEQADSLEPPALRFLTLAGERALGLDTTAALADFQRALKLTPPGHRDRTEVLLLLADAARQAGRPKDAAQALEEAIVDLRRLGDIPAAARAMVRLSGVLRRLLDQRGFELPAEALALLEPLPPGQELVEALTEMAYMNDRAASPEEELAWAEKALDLAERLGIDPPPTALGSKGSARVDLGDAGGLEDCRQALALAIERGQGWEAAALYNNLGSALADFEGPRSALEAWREGLLFSEQRGIAEWGHHMKENIGALALVEMGSLDEALDVLTTLGREFEALADDEGVADVACYQLTVQLMRGEATPSALGESLDYVERSLEAIDERTGDLVTLVVFLYQATLFAAAIGDCERAVLSLRRISVIPHAGATDVYAPCLPQLVRVALSCRDTDVAEHLLIKADRRNPYSELAAMTAGAAIAEGRGTIEEAAGSYAAVAGRWERFGHVPEQGFALLGQGRCLLGLARPTEASPVLQHARGIFEGLRAAPALSEIDALLRRARAPGP